MRRQTVGEILFWSAGALALALYGLTAPEGLPWNASAALAATEDAVGGPVLPHPVWRYFVAMAEGRFILLASLAAAVSAGLIAAIVNRYFGWRVGAAAALAWIFLPGVWYRAIAGERGLCLVAAVVIAAWGTNAAVLWLTHKALRALERMTGGADMARTLTGLGREAKHGKGVRIFAWSVLGAAGLFAVVSATLHDYRYGEVASVYARQIVEEAGERIILLNGVCDAQVEREVARKSAGKKSARPLSTISFRGDDANRARLVAAAKGCFPAETNLWIVAQVSPSAFVDAVMKVHPDRFYSMMGQSTTPEKWAARWSAMSPYLASRDPFIPMLRHSFAFEGNVLASGLRAKDRLKAAWKVYWRVFTEIEPKNPVACANLKEMLDHGYKTDDLTRQRIESARTDLVKRASEKKVVKPEAAEDLKTEDLKSEKLKADDLKAEDLKTLTEWNKTMMKAFSDRDLDKAARIARAILSRRPWRNFIPANMILGEQLLSQGDPVAAEAFFRVAIDGKGEAAPPPIVLNDYAETLRQLKRFDEAETYARKAVEQTGEKGWIFKVTLAQILRDRGDKADGDEIRKLVKDALKQAPEEGRRMIRKEFPR